MAAECDCACLRCDETGGCCGSQKCVTSLSLIRYAQAKAQRAKEVDHRGA